MHITVQSDGVAVRCCARLLQRNGIFVTAQLPGRAKALAIMIGATTQRLFRDAFERDDLFDGLPVIVKRVVAWGADREPRALPHSAVVVSEQVLLEKLGTAAGSAECDGQERWTIVASRPLPDACVEHSFGTRTAQAVPVRLRRDADASACWIESLENGWVFVISGAPPDGWLLAVGDTGEFPFAGSRLVNRQIAEIAGEPAEFPCYPRIAWPLCGPGWMACGSGALAFDPLCGDGSGNAIREAILAAAVLRAIGQGGDREELLAHYRMRLLAGFERHLEICADYYRTGGSTAWWETQLRHVRDGLDWCATELGRAKRTAAYQLRGFELERVEARPV